MKNRIKILVTLGPSSLNRKFLKFCVKEKVQLLRLNMSHIEIEDLDNQIKFIKKNIKNAPICIDTEGAQIRTKNSAEKKIFLKMGKKFSLSKDGTKLSLYPLEIFDKLKINDLLLIGFEDLKAKVISIKKDKIVLKVINSGFIEGNKGVHVENRNINLNFLTKKDYQAIKIGKKNNIKNYALSFTSSSFDIKNFKKILPSENKIYKIETKKACHNLESIIKEGESFLIDRGDLSKEVDIENIPIFQRKIIKHVKKYKKKEVFVATNLLESMIKNSYPTRAEANDIFNCLEMGSNGLVLAAETAIGSHPEKAISFLKKVIKKFNLFK